MAREATAKYLARYAAEEAANSHTITGAFERAVVVPACGETSEFVAPLESAARRAPGMTLCLVVVNGRDDHSEAVHRANQLLLADLRAHESERLRVVAIDRASPGKRFGRKQGVGSARRIGCDVAIALAHEGRLASPWIFNTDGDARVPIDYFAAVADVAATATAVSLPFWHRPCGDIEIDEAHALYEMSLRYYCLGLAWAGSAYSHHSMGSAMVFHRAAYTAVRGVPHRQAGEDFYVLDKLAKLGVIAQPDAAVVDIASRRSQRVPFGTGRAVGDIADRRGRGEEFLVYNPRCFVALRRLLGALADSRRGPVEPALDQLRRDPELAGPLASLGAFAAIAEAHRRSPDPVVGYRGVNEWLDGFRTMRLIHLLRDEKFPNVAWRDAFRSAPFVGLDPDATLAVAREQMFEIERGRRRAS